MNNDKLTTEDLDLFFKQLNELESQYIYWAQEPPKKLIINPGIIAKLARVEGFYQRPELQSTVTIYAPVVRHFKLEHTVVTIREDYDENYLHFE